MDFTDKELLINNCLKYEYHCHLNGNIGTKFSEKFIPSTCLNQIKLGQITPESFFKNLKLFNKVIVENFENLEQIVEEIVLSFIEQNCIYLEIRDTIRLNKSFSIDEYFNKVFLSFKTLQQKYKYISLQFVLSFHRSSEFFSRNIDIFNYLKQMPYEFKEFISTVDFSGDQNLQSLPFNVYEHIFKGLKESGYNLTLHAFENPVDDCFDDIVRLKPTRISQCFFLNDKEKLDSLINSKIPLEVCPTSAEIFTGKSIERLDNYRYLIDNNHPILIGSDSACMMNTNITNEYKKFGMLFDDKNKLENYLIYQKEYTIRKNELQV
jgi:adenosine deaminase